MILIDAGPLIALLNANDPHHGRCVNAGKTLPAVPLLTTWPCFTEAMYLLGDIGGHPYQAKLWELYQQKRLLIHDLAEAEIARMVVLMATYRNVPMDLADASLVATAEHRALFRIFTLDSDFYIYRLADGNMLEVIP